MISSWCSGVLTRVQVRGPSYTLLYSIYILSKIVLQGRFPARSPKCLEKVTLQYRLLHALQRIVCFSVRPSYRHPSTLLSGTAIHEDQCMYFRGD
jgi:hypothetical protein